MNEAEVAAAIVEMERFALEIWAQGNPDEFLNISSPDVSYFDPFLDKRLDGLDALRALYSQLRGQFHIEHFEMIEPRVQVAGEAAILSFQFKSTGSEGSMLWNTTEVYQQTAAGWRIVHTHWAFNRPGASKAAPEPLAS
jgi:ketosteroid isomerase-like protein